jgi:hypothetical protein
MSLEEMRARAERQGGPTRFDYMLRPRPLSHEDCDRRLRRALRGEDRVQA